MLTYQESAFLCRSLADETRQQIVDMLSCGERCACNILEKFSVTQPTLSYHMKVLTDCGLVIGRKEGIWMHYRIDETKFDELRQFLQMISTPKSECLCEDQE